LALFLANYVSLWVCITSCLDTIYCWLLNSIFLNSSIGLFIKAAKYIAPPLLFLLELSPWVISGLLVGRRSWFRFRCSWLLRSIGDFLVSCVLASVGGASTGVLLFSATAPPTELFNEPLLVVFSWFHGFSYSCFSYPFTYHMDLFIL